MQKQNKKFDPKASEDWLQKKWRPMMAVMYMIVCVFDFVLFPIMFTVVQFWETEAVNDAFRQWQPLTLLGGGLFHVAMGAVLGVTAWSRGQEKIAGANNGGLQLPTSMPAASTTPAPMGQFQSSNYQNAVATPLYTSQQPASAMATGWGGKKIVPQVDHPEI